MSHNINLWFDQQQIDTLHLMYKEIHKKIYKTKNITTKDLEDTLNWFYLLLDSSIKKNPDVYHELSIEDFKTVINGFVFNQHNPTKSEYKLLFVIKNALMNTVEGKIKTQPGLWEDCEKIWKIITFIFQNNYKFI